MSRLIERCHNYGVAVYFKPISLKYCLTVYELNLVLHGLRNFANKKNKKNKIQKYKVNKSCKICQGHMMTSAFKYILPRLIM